MTIIASKDEKKMTVQPVWDEPGKLQLRVDLDRTTNESSHGMFIYLDYAEVQMLARECVEFFIQQEKEFSEAKGTGHGD